MANNVSEFPTPTTTEQTLSTPAACVLHEATYADKVVKLFTTENVIKDANRLAGADFRKEVRAGYSDTVKERIAHARGES
jgi:hypothetical protein